jgi:glycosyltransferase involved in cell wall biosynthesis
MTANSQSVNTVSVVIPVFNAAKWIKETIDSILTQTYPVLEILIVDDGSTDETAGIVQEYGAPVRYINQKHRGVSAARNLGIALARGNLIAFIDGDDYWHPRKIESQVKLLNEKKLSWVSCEIQPFNTNTRSPIDGLASPMQDGDVLKALFMNNFIGSASPMVQRSVFDEVGLFNEAHEARIGEDWDMWLRIASKHPLGVVYEKLAFLRIHSTSAMSSTSMEEKVKCLIGVIERAAERDANRLGALKKEALAGVYYNAGVQSFKQGQYSQAGNYFRHEIKYRPLKLESYIYWLMTKLGPNFSRLLIHGKRLITQSFHGTKRNKS